MKIFYFYCFASQQCSYINNNNNNSSHKGGRPEVLCHKSSSLTNTRIINSKCVFVSYHRSAPSILVRIKSLLKSSHTFLPLLLLPVWSARPGDKCALVGKALIIPLSVCRCQSMRVDQFATLSYLACRIEMKTKRDYFICLHRTTANKLDHNRNQSDTDRRLSYQLSQIF